MARVGSLVAEPAGARGSEEVSLAGQPVILCEDVSKSFGDTSVIKGVSLAIEPGEILVLVGPSGSGKTTFLRMVAGFESPDTGTVTLEGRKVAGDGVQVPPEARRLGMVFQDYALFPHMTVAQNVSFGLKGWSGRARERRVQDMLEMVRLFDLGGRYPYQLSGGEQQRVALARSLAPRPVAILLDEPFSNLGPQLRLQLRAEVKSILRSSDVTAVYVTHDQEEALYMGDRVALLNGGRLEQVGAPEEVFHHPGTRFVARFLGNADFIPATVTGKELVTEIGALCPDVPMEPGTEIEVLARPDDVAFRPSSTGPGRVVSRVFRGMHYLYGLSLPSGAVVHSLQHHSVYYRQGATVEVYLEPGQTLTGFLRAPEPGGDTPSQVVQLTTSGDSTI